MDTVDAAGLAIGDEHPPRVMGVLNVSEESPYDPSVFDDPGEAAAYVDESLLDEGADIVDVGLESANKRFEVLSAAAELARLDIAVDAMHSTSGDAVWSIETRYGEVAEAALDAGFDMVNDIAGFADPKIPEVCARRDVAVAKMASPPDLTRPGAVEETPWAERNGETWAAEADYVDMVYEALKQNGLTDKTIVDPAFGGWSEAKTIEDDRETFRRLREFRGLGRPMLVSINRKNFLRSLTDRSTEDALAASLAATAMAVERGAHVIRTHDVRETVDAVAVGHAFTRERIRSGDPGAGADVAGAGQTGADPAGADPAGADSAGADRAGSNAESTGAEQQDDVVVEELDVTTVGEAERHAERFGVTVDAVEAGVGRVVLVDGLGEVAMRALQAAAADADVAVAPTTEGGCVLAGTIPAFERLSTADSDGRTSLTAVYGRISDLVS